MHGLTLAAKGAALLLSGPSPAAKYLVNAAFDKQGRGRQLVSTYVSDVIVFLRS